MGSGEVVSGVWGRPLVGSGEASVGSGEALSGVWGGPR